MLSTPAFAELPAPSKSSTFTRWFVTDEAASPVELQFEKNKNQPIFSIVPRALYRTTEDVRFSDKADPIWANTLFIEINNGLERRVCSLERRYGSAYQCLQDADGDGRHEIFYGEQAFSEFFFGSNFGQEGMSKLSKPTKLERLPLFSLNPPIPLELVWTKGGKNSDLVFRACVSETSQTATEWENGLYGEFCMEREFVAKGKGFPREIKIFTAKLTVLGIEGKQANIRIERSGGLTPITFSRSAL